MATSRRLTLSLFPILSLAITISSWDANGSPPTFPIHIQMGLDALISAYPATLSHYTHSHLVTTDGARLLIDDGKHKTHKEKLASADIEDSLSQVYPAHTPLSPPENNRNPGRIRAQYLLDQLYGTSRRETEKTLVPVNFFGRTVRVTSRHGMAQALRRVVRRLQNEKTLRTWLIPPGGTYNWRNIAGTTRRSLHSYGAAIDLNIKRSRYWRWDQSSNRKPFVPDTFPRLLVEAFEQEGFIWGGRWFHYDSMHFEYRPELFSKRNKQ